jgi:hypothetical protein
MNLKYYSYQLHLARRINFWVELILAFAASSAVGGLWLFESTWGGVAWRWLGAVAAILSVYQVVGKRADRIQSLEKRVSGFRALDFDLSRLVTRAQQRAAYDDELNNYFEAILDRKREIVLSYQDPSTNGKLLDRCMKEVLEEIPVDSLFVPYEVPHGQS